MCGIIGYVGPRECKPLLLHGLERLEYRGYDSAGIALLESSGLRYTRAVGPLQNLRQRAGETPSPATTGLGHTRWATHGGVTEENAHPLAAERPETLAVVLNGIVENYRELRARLAAAGHTFTSETDAETVTHLIEEHYEGDLVEAVRGAYNELEGHYAFVAIHRDHPGELVGARHQCPMVVGLAAGETYVASNAAAFLRETRDVQFPSDGEVVAVTPQGSSVLPRRGRGTRRARGRRARLGRRGRREGRLRDVHAQGDPRAAGRGRGDDRRPPPQGPPRARRARDGRRRAAGPAPDRDPGRGHRLPRRRRGAVRDRGVGPRAGGARHRLRVDLPQSRARRRHARDRHLAVRRDARHDRGDEARALDGRAHRRDHEHDGIADHARGRLGPLHALRDRDGRRRLEDLHGAALTALPRRDEARPGARDAARRGARVHRQRALRPSRQDRASSSRATIRSTRSRGSSTTGRSSSTSVATSGSRSRSRARSS